MTIILIISQEIGIKVATITIISLEISLISSEIRINPTESPIIVT